MRLVLAAAAFLALATPAFGTVVQFRTPSANIGCGYVSASGRASLRCDILSGLKPRPAKPRGCKLDWGFGYGMSSTGRAHAVCAGDTAVDRGRGSCATATASRGAASPASHA